MHICMPSWLGMPRSEYLTEICHCCRSARAKVACKHVYFIHPAHATAGLHVAVVDYNWNRHGRVIDIGGAYGSFLASILAKHAKPRGVLFDQSQACHSAPQNLHIWLLPCILLPGMAHAVSLKVYDATSRSCTSMQLLTM